MTKQLILAVAAILGCSGFAAVCGSSVACSRRVAAS